MAIASSNESWNHRSVYFEFTGDGVTTAISVQTRKTLRPAKTAVAFGVTAPSNITHKANRGGLPFPDGTAVAIASVAVSAAGVVTVTTTAAVANATKAYIVVLFDQPGD